MGCQGRGRYCPSRLLPSLLRQEGSDPHPPPLDPGGQAQPLPSHLGVQVSALLCQDPHCSSLRIWKWAADSPISAKPHLFLCLSPCLLLHLDLLSSHPSLCLPHLQRWTCHPAACDSGEWRISLLSPSLRASLSEAQYCCRAGQGPSSCLPSAPPPWDSQASKAMAPPYTPKSALGLGADRGQVRLLQGHKEINTELC